MYIDASEQIMWILSLPTNISLKIKLLVCMVKVPNILLNWTSEVQNQRVLGTRKFVLSIFTFISLNRVK